MFIVAILVIIIFAIVAMLVFQKISSGKISGSKIFGGKDEVVATTQQANGSDSIFSEKIIGKYSGLPIPRFVATKSSKSNIRRGPSLNHPIKWQITQKNIPLKVTKEFENWLHVADIQSDVGWVHKSMVKGNSYAILLREANLLKHPNKDAVKQAIIEQGFHAKFEDCKEQFCFFKILRNNIKINGYIQQKFLWGATP